LLIKHWLLIVVPGHTIGRLLTGLALFTILFPLFRLGVSAAPEDRTPALFFSLVIAYIVPVFSYITEKAEESLRELRPLLDMDEAKYQRTYSSLSSAPPWQIALQLLLGISAGMIHWVSLEGSITNGLAALAGSRIGMVSATGTLLTWMIMTSIIFMLIRQARIFAGLGKRHVHANPLDVRSLTPFARVSISASLSTIGALALFPLIGLEGGIDLQEILPGTIAMIVPLIAIFLLPVWPLHRRLAATKQENLLLLDRKIAESLDEGGFINVNAEHPAQLNLLLTYRRELERSRTWPFDMGNFSRFALYLIIPPLTWVAAALIENLVDSVL
jgi:hypothetical protein